MCKTLVSIVDDTVYIIKFEMKSDIEIEIGSVLSLRLGKCVFHVLLHDVYSILFIILLADFHKYVHINEK